MRNMHLTEGLFKRLVVRILGPLRELGETETLEVDVEPEMNLIEALGRLPERLRERVLVHGGIAADLLVLVDGVELSCLESAEDIRVEDIGEIVLIPIIHGG
ncbi:MAG: MoaD/ThiS family protein [Nitrososphaeria archaeon]|nr:MoaD/ThiS family protein [Nitrososphaeria archaeon]MDW8021074.1 MoaD/ThiS family protein [Nitrososphaerota archaeon]